jgi:argininosuccinate lyase
MIDRAHVAMLARQGILDREMAALLLDEIEALEKAGFPGVVGEEPVRGQYLLYESALVERAGSEVAGNLHRGRSRNDLSATALRLTLRIPLTRVQQRLHKLISILVRRAAELRAAPIPLYTHLRPAVEGTVGHYFCAVAMALTRDADALMNLWRDLDTSPLGAGAVGGTSLPIDCTYTAMLLGFNAPINNSIDAVASRDSILRLLSDLAILSVTLGRLATDLLIWSSEEFGFVSLPDHLVGSSSALPQKRNPFLLEHVQARSASAAGAFMAAVTAMTCKPFSNSVAVGTEAVRHVWNPLVDVTQTIEIAQAVVAGASFNMHAIERRLAETTVSAAELADHLAARGIMPFREAHHRVGILVSEAEEQDRPLANVVADWASTQGFDIDPCAFAPGALVSARDFGGGPGARSIERQIDILERHLARLRGALHEILHRHRSAWRQLNAEVTSLRTRSKRSAAEVART